MHRCAGRSDKEAGNFEMQTFPRAEAQKHEEKNGSRPHRDIDKAETEALVNW